MRWPEVNILFNWSSNKDFSSKLSKIKTLRENCELYFNIWISIFGAPLKFFSDNDSDFSNEDYSEMCESLPTFCSSSFENPIPEY